MRYLLFIAGLGGLLYGIDVGIIAGALPYLQDTSGLSSNQLSIIVAAVLLGSVISTAFAGMLADLLGRKKLMALSGVFFVISIPMIALAHGFGPLVLGRLLQGVSAGFVGVVVPLYLAECLSAANRGKGTGVFQWLLTLGIFVAAVIAYLFSFRAEQIEKLGDPQRLFAFKDLAWRSIFWVSALPGVLFVIGSFFVAESPRWLFQKGKKEAARAALLRTRKLEEAETEMKEMEAAAVASEPSTGERIKDSLLRRKYVIPFLLACVILACNQATGINSIIGYNATILIQAGLSDTSAHLGYVILTLVNFLMTMVAVALVDKKGRKFLLSVGSAGIILTLVCTGLIFRRTEKLRVDCREAVQALVTPEQSLSLKFTPELSGHLLESAGGKSLTGRPSTLILIYSYGDFRAATKVVRSTDPLADITLTREICVPKDKAAALAARITNPLANAEAARHAPLKIEHALVTPVPSSGNGWAIALFTFIFIAFFAMGPGVCVWLALSELMPTRIRSNGMSIALLINQAVSTTIAAVFLPTVGAYGYSTMFFLFAGSTVIYFITAAFLLPETKGKTLEEIEAHFEGKD